MAENNENEKESWIVDGVLGHELFNRIENSPRVHFNDGIAVIAKLVKIGEDINLIRLAGEEVDGPEDWAEPFGLMNPEMRTGFSFSYKMSKENPRKVKMATYSRTIHGANFVHEFGQERGEKAEAMIRCPVPDELRDEALGIADNYQNTEMVREQAGAFNERFNITDINKPMSYWEPHIKVTDVTQRSEMLEVFDEVLDVVERGVRISMNE